MKFGVKLTWASVLAPPFSGCVISDESVHLKTRFSVRLYITHPSKGCHEDLNKMKYIKSHAQYLSRGRYIIEAGLYYNIHSLS